MNSGPIALRKWLRRRGYYYEDLLLMSSVARRDDATLRVMRTKMARSWNPTFQLASLSTAAKFEHSDGAQFSEQGIASGWTSACEPMEVTRFEPSVYILDFLRFELYSRC